MKPIRQAIFPVAGLGTRFLPATKANPKEMLPIVDKPLIQYAVEEAVAAGITELVFVTSSAKRAIEDHFDTNFELEHTLEKQQKFDLLNMVQNIVPKGVTSVYVRQARALGLGHAVLCARKVIGDNPFAVLLADDLIDAKVPCLKQMVETYEAQQSSIIAVQRIAPQDSDKYGVVAFESALSQATPISGIVEKPKPVDAPSQFGVVGRYLLTPQIFDILEHQVPGRGGEIQLTDAIATLLHYQRIIAYAFEGKRYDCGNKLGYMQAQVVHALKHPEISKDFHSFLASLTVVTDNARAETSEWL